VPGQARGQLTGDPGQYGEHIDDQRVMFWDGEYKDGRFADVGGQVPQEPKVGVRLYEDDKGVLVVYGESASDVWFGAGYAAGQQRLFLPTRSAASAAAPLPSWSARAVCLPMCRPGP